MSKQVYITHITTHNFMKRIYFLLTLAILCYCSCYKDEESYPPPRPVYDEVSVNGYDVKSSNAVVSINDSQATPSNVFVSLITGDANDMVSCSFSGLPAGITVSIDSSILKLPANFTGNFTAICDTGFYNIILTVSYRNKGLIQYPFRLQILPVPDAAKGLVGTYNGSDPCGHYSLGDIWYTYTATIATIPGYPHWVSIRNFRAIGDSFYVYADVRQGFQIH